MDRVRSVIREARERILVVDRGHGDDVRNQVARRVRRIGIVVRRAVAGGRDKQHVGLVRPRDLVEERLRERTARPAVREHAHVRRTGRERRLHLDRELHRVDGVGECACPARRQELQAHHAREPVDAGDACAVVADGADRAGDVCAVEMIVERIARPRKRVEAVRARGAGDRLTADRDAEARRRGPDIRRQIRMRIVDAGVDDADDGVA